MPRMRLPIAAAIALVLSVGCMNPFAPDDDGGTPESPQDGTDENERQGFAPPIEVHFA